jgi:hypothetical protein
VSDHNAALTLSAATATVRTNPASAQGTWHVARQRSDVRLAIGTALFAANQDRREILSYRIAGYPSSTAAGSAATPGKPPSMARSQPAKQATALHLRR